MFAFFILKMFHVINILIAYLFRFECISWRAYCHVLKSYRSQSLVVNIEIIELRTHRRYTIVQGGIERVIGFRSGFPTVIIYNT